jgi:thiol-disulfide isomerase/thioredoxin
MLAMARPTLGVSQFMERVMKKALISVITVAVLVGGVILLNRTIPQTKATGPGPVGGTATAPGQESTLSMQDVVLKGLDGNEVRISDLKGKVVLVDFWGTFCEPCKEEAPWLIEFQKKYGPRGFTILGVAVDEGGKSVVEPYVKNTRFDVNGTKELLNFPIFLTTDALNDKVGLIGYPTEVLIARDGHVVQVSVGLAPGGKEEMIKEIEALM